MGGVRWPTTLPTSESSSSAVTWTTTEAVSQRVVARASSGDGVRSKHTSFLDAGKYCTRRIRTAHAVFSKAISLTTGYTSKLILTWPEVVSSVACITEYGYKPSRL